MVRHLTAPATRGLRCSLFSRAALGLGPSMYASQQPTSLLKVPRKFPPKTHHGRSLLHTNLMLHRLLDPWRTLLHTCIRAPVCFMPPDGSYIVLTTAFLCCVGSDCRMTAAWKHFPRACPPPPNAVRCARPRFSHPTLCQPANFRHTCAALSSWLFE